MITDESSENRLDEYLPARVNIESNVATWQTLTQTEQKIWALYCLGWSQVRIAEFKGCTRSAIHQHIESIKRKNVPQLTTKSLIYIRAASLESLGDRALAEITHEKLQASDAKSLANIAIQAYDKALALKQTPQNTKETENNPASPLIALSKVA